ncbi:hypothetical protein [Bathycoccus sp. RCC716 virus 1]|uniref:Capsid protein n=1 Tax=Bathycoccus sp. RCC716 virus 1 TaxID=2530038 RepID=A0A7S6P1M7_9PHYC|nr:hypothetical protein [Bathycoccus sp. RCC716 virus 1]|tara:strand:+ start:43 stop:1077 length:1035 start_codon:yes stop_codon:yes gene_type:complete
MSSGIVQLIAIGAQDEHIMGEPEISFFTSTFKRHSNFSQSVEKQTIQGNVKANSMSSIRFDRTGDMLGYTYLTIDNNTKALDIQRWDTLIDKVELLIGGQVIDTQDAIFTEKIAIDTFATNVSKSANGPHPGVSAQSYFYPFRFFFCEGAQCALPIVALHYHNVELRIHWGTDAGNYNFECYSNYYYLDNEERGNLVSRNHNLIITQVQKSIPSNELSQELTFNHPVKYLASSDTTTDGALTSESNKIKIEINGLDIGNFKWAKPHFIDVMTYYHTNFVTSPDFFLYCFCLSTSSLQPTGTLNFSRLDSVKIVSQSIVISDPIYAVNYNILRIENGMAGLIYAN